MRNAAAGADLVVFNIPGGGREDHRSKLSPLPAITDAVTIDGTTQPGFANTPVIELNGAAAGTSLSTNGISILSGATTVRGLAVNRFERSGIDITMSGGNIIEGTF